MITYVQKFRFRYVLLMHSNVELVRDFGPRPLEHTYQRFRPARRPPAILRAGPPDGFSVNPEPLNGYKDCYIFMNVPIIHHGAFDRDQHSLFGSTFAKLVS